MTSAPKPTLVVFAGGFGATPAERLVDSARLASALDTIESWLPHAPAILATDDANVLAAEDQTHPEPRSKGLPAQPDELTEPVEAVSPTFLPNLTIDHDLGPFHFGRRLAGIIRRHNLTHVVYLGAGSVPFFTAEDLTALANAAGVAVTNNLYSSDLIAFPVRGSALEVIETVDRDNALARALHEQTDIHVEELPRSLATQFDIDAPTDVAALALHPSPITHHPLGSRLRRHLATVDLPLGRYRAVLPLFLDQTRQILVAGRVGSHTWAYLERETACRVRLFAEERGMEADDRVDTGRVRSLLGLYIDAVGIDAFFAAIPELCDAAFVDTRVLLAHKRIAATRSDRFLSDLGQPHEIADPFLRDFTLAALAAPIPVLLGGHSLMSGDLMLLNEHAWSLRDAGAL